MKKYLLASCVSLCILNANAAPKQAITCQPEYLGQKFYMAYIYSGLGDFGPAECVYSNDRKNFIRYDFPSNEEYEDVSGDWRSAMPGDQWCSVEFDGTAETCKFALRDIIQGKRND